jgi:hypothetical protein
MMVMLEEGVGEVRWKERTVKLEGVIRRGERRK